MRRSLLPAVLFLLGAAVLLPLLRFMLLPVFPALAPEFAPPGGASPALRAAISGSLLVSTAGGLVTAPVATALGFLLERRSWAGRRLCAGACWTALLLPGYLLVAGWEIVLDAPAWPPVPPTGPGLAAAWMLLVGAMAAKALPLSVLASRVGWSLLPPALEDAIRVNLHRAAGRLRVLLAASMPIALLCFLLCFEQSMDEYGIAVVLGRQLHLHLLAAEVSASLLQWPVSWPHAATCADLLVGVSLLPFLLRHAIRRGGAAVDFVSPGPRRVASPGGRALAWSLSALLSGPGLIVPMLALCADLAAGPRGTVSPEGAYALLWSALYALVSATGAVVLATAALAASTAGTGRTMLLGTLPLFALSVPGIVLGAAFVIAYGSAPVPVLGTPLALLLAQVATSLPLGLLLLREPMGQAMRNRDDAGRVHGIGQGARIERIHAPPLLPPLVAAWCLCFCRLFFELPLAQMLAPAGREPVAVILVGLGESLRLRDEAVLACAGIGICAAVVSAATVLGARLR